MKKCVLVAVLDWGLGHASRCMPIIRELQDQNCEIILGGSGSSLELLRREFPRLEVLSLPGYSPAYPVRGMWMTCKMLVQIPKFVHAIRHENEAISRFVTNRRVDLIISDNRFGCYHAKVKSIFITHQLNIIVPAWAAWAGVILNKINHAYISKFSSCWIPDDPRSSIAGVLILNGRLPKEIRTEYIGNLSRFIPTQQPERKYDLVVVLSGPEPQRSILENLLLPQLEKSRYSFFVVRGLPFEGKQDKANVVAYLTSADLQNLIESSEVVIARSGYSTVMDLLALKKKAILIPTPGQTEQEYLAMALKEKKVFYSMNQDVFNLEQAIDELAGYSPVLEKTLNDRTLMRSAIRKLLGET
ncbi:MAG TPA: glycosyltransferase [Chryseosolibacter sp.]|nr:glycosyltransferase [Chryseosolibacter sp.]